MSGVSINGPPVETMDGGGRALKLQTDAPHLVSMGGDRLSTSVTLHPIPQGRVVLGSGPGIDIPVQGTGVLPVHCHIENSEGVVTIYPLSDNLCIDGIKVTTPTRLSQGAMLTIGRSNYLRFNHPAEAKLMKSVLPNPRISMPPMTFEQENQCPTKFLKKPPAVPKKSPRSSFEDTDDEKPSSIMTKVSKFEYLAAQNMKKSISPKVFSANLITVNTPAKDVLGKSPPDLQSYAKNLPQSALNYSESNYHENKSKISERQLFGKKSPSQYVNVAVNETKNINNKVVIYENGCTPKNHNVNFDHNELNIKTSSCAKNINVNRVLTPSPSYNRNPGPYTRSVTPNPVSNSVHLNHRKSGSLGELPIDSYYDGTVEEINQRKKDAEIKRNQAQEDRIKEQQLEKAEQARLEEILNMCAEYEKQSQNEKNKPITPNRIITNGSLPRDKRQQFPSSPFGSPPGNYITPPSSPAAIDLIHRDFQKNTNHHAYENFKLSHPVPRNKVTSNYENVDIIPLQEKPLTNGDVSQLDIIGSCENQFSQHNSSPHYPQSPRTRIRTFVTSSKENLPKDTSTIIENKFALLEKEQNLLKSFNKPKDVSTENLESLEVVLGKLTTSKFILPLDDVDFIFQQDKKFSDSPIDSISISNSNNTSNSIDLSISSNKDVIGEKEMSEIERDRCETLRKENVQLLKLVSSLKRLMDEIDIQEEEIHRGIEMEKALLSGERKSKILELERIEMRKSKLIKRAQRIEENMRDCQLKQGQHQKDCKEKLRLAQDGMTKIEEKLSSTEKTSAEYESVFEEYLKTQEILDNERKTFEDLEFHHLEEEADWLASREELQREIMDLTQQIDTIERYLCDLDQQISETNHSNNKEYKILEAKKINCLVRLEEIRTRLKDIDREMSAFPAEDSEREISSETDSDRSKDNFFSFDPNVVHDLSCSIIVSNSKLPNDHLYNMSQSFNEKLMHEKSILEDCELEKKYPSQDDIDRISKVTNDAPIDIGSLGRKTIESLKEIERNRHLHLCQQGSQVIEHERQRVQALKEKAQQEVRTNWAHRIQDCDRLSPIIIQENGSGGKVNDKNDESETKGDMTQRENEDLRIQRPLSEISDMSLEVGTLTRKRGKPAGDKQRPLTRYLPIRGTDLDLKLHIESAGHQVVLCPHVIINSSTCRGFLHKKGSKLNNWSKRWFVFDRSRHTFSYYSDKSEKKPRGGAYFQAIEEVYVDHSKIVKSPNPQLTFIVKTHGRIYYLMAPSPEAMRIWVDVIFTGAEGYQEFEHGT